MPSLPAKNRQNSRPAHIFPNRGTEHIKPVSRGRRTRVMWEGGDVVGGVALPLFVSTLIDPKHVHTHTHTHTHVFSFYVICLWHNCRSVSLVHPSQPQCGTEACWQNQSCGYQPYELSYLWLWSQRFCCFVYHINSDWQGLRSFWDLAGNLESQLESWILVQTKTLKWSWVFREEVPFYKAVLLG